MTAADIMAVAEIRDAVNAHAMAWFPKECCGLLVTGPNGPAAILTHNGIDALHDTDPKQYERTGETGYHLDPAEIVKSEARGERLVAIFHSHCRVGAYFSDEDKRQALSPWDEPWFPGIEYVVLDAQEDAVAGFKVFAFDDKTQDFLEV